MKNNSWLLAHTVQAFIAGVVLSVVILASFVVFEPVISRAIVDNFVVTQSITGEIAFSVPANDVTMTPPIASLTGGTSTGATQVVVTTNSVAGYNMTLGFASTTAMVGNTNGGSIPDYTPTTGGVPDYTFTVAPNAAEFGYTVEASTTNDLDPTFRNSGVTCASGGSDDANACWIDPAASSSPETIINRTTALPQSGATTTIKFQLVVNANPVPGIPADTYTATATLTALTN